MTDLLMAWERWDRFPASQGNADHMEDACKELASSLGMTTTELRVLLAQKRREGKSYLEIEEGLTRKPSSPS